MMLKNLTPNATEERPRYMIEFLKTKDGRWRVSGYNNIAFPGDSYEWDLDGKPQYFSTLENALEFVRITSKEE